MKIAILLRGHVRNYEKIIENFNFLIKNNLDYELNIFIHTWDIINYNSDELTNVDKIIQLYNPKKIKIDNQKNVVDEEIFYKNANRKKFVFQLYSIHILKKMLIEYESENNIIFDYVIHTRFDILYNTTITNIIESMKDYDILTFPKKTYYDIYCVCKRNILNVYSVLIQLYVT